jgi:hypothetical protein
LDYYSVVLNTGIESVSRYYEEVLRTSAPQMKQRSNAPKARSALLFRGIAGDTAQNAFLVTNNRPETIDIQLDMSELVSEDGTSRVQPEALFSPDRCRLGPRAEQVVQCSVRLGSEIPAGVDFRGRILVAGFPELAMDVRLHADRPAEPAPDTPYEQPAATGVRHKPSPKKAEAKSESKNATKPT